MQIELIGCTGAGKSSLSYELIKTNYRKDLHIVTSYDFVLKWAHFNWVKKHRIRMLVLNLLALLACLITWRKNLKFYRFVISVILRLPGSISLSEKLKIARVAFRNVGIYEIVRQNRSEGQVILADEGTLHIAHYLFVHAAVKPNMPDLETFLRLVSLPDVAVYVRQPESVLISRTRSRGHKRIPKGASDLVNRFIQHSLAVFEKLVLYSRVEDRLLVVDRGEVIEPGWGSTGDPRLEFAQKILKSNFPTES